MRKFMKEVATIFAVMCALLTFIPPQAKATHTVSPEEARALAEEGYIFAYAIIENYKTMFGMCIYPDSPVYSGFNKYLHARKLYDPDFKLVVTPNNDTLYSTTFADLRTEPIVISVPPTGDRYFSIQLVDMATDNFAYIGTRATGTNGGNYLLVGPHFKGSLSTAKFDRVIVAPSQFIALATRTAVDGQEDIPGAAAVQDGLKITLLSQFLKQPAPKSAPPIDFPAFDQAKAESIEFISYLNRLLEWHVTTPGKAALLQRLGRIGVRPYRPFDPNKLTPAVRSAMEEGVKAGQAKIEDLGNNLGKRIDGWEYTPPMGNYGTDYPFRSAVAWKFLYTHNPEEALYPIANVDGSGQALNGSQRYVLHFTKDQIPPVKAFWSITLYDTKTRLLVHNPIKRYSIGDRTKGLKYGKDGSLTLYIQHKSPGKDKESNWLPTSTGAFYLITRAYIPKESMLKGEYRLPPVKRVQ